MSDETVIIRRDDTRELPLVPGRAAGPSPARRRRAVRDPRLVLAAVLAGGALLLFLVLLSFELAR